MNKIINHLLSYKYAIMKELQENIAYKNFGINKEKELIKKFNKIQRVLNYLYSIVNNTL